MANQKTILLVEHEALVASDEAKILRAEGFQVEMVYSGEDAVTRVNAAPESVDLILIEIQLGTGLDGAQTAREILRARDIPIIFLSAQADPEMVEKIKEIPAYGFVVKSGGLAALLANIQIVFRMHAACQNLQRVKIQQEQEITRRKQAEENLTLEKIRLQTQLELHQREGASQKELLDYSLDPLMRATQSQFAFIGLLDSDEAIMTIHSWSMGAMERCAVETMPIHFPVAEAGLWGECVRKRRPTVVNDYTLSPIRRGVPNGHVPIERFLGVPIFNGAKIVAVAATANKPSDYTDEDITALEMLTEQLWGVLQRKQTQEQLQRRTRELNERLKELNCLYSLSKVVENQGNQLDTTLKEMVALIPSAYQYPEITCARVVANGKEYQTDNYHETRWQQVCDILMHNQQIGYVEVGYLDQRPTCDEGPFLKEERRLIHAIAERVGRIIERWQAEEMLVQNEAWLSAIFNYSREAIGVSLNGVHILVNPAYLAMFGYNHAGELIGKPIQELIAPESRATIRQNVQARAQGKNAPTSYETMAIRQDGTIFPMEVKASSFRMAGENYTLVMLRDITERKQAEEKLKRSVQEKEALTAELKQLVKNGLEIAANLLSIEGGRLPDESTRTVFVNTQSRLRSMLSLYEQLNRSGLIERIDLSEYIESLVMGLSQSYTRQGGPVNIHFQLENVQVDLKRTLPLGIILNELMTNTFKYAFPVEKMPNGEQGTICVRLAQSAGEVELCVTDNGVVIDDERPCSGTGLELVKMLTEQIGGSFTMDSTNGCTATLTFRAE